mmetsp:Transcript_138062/g.349827  ORF Transcript_138062/g.349827 Transcript_138062/m.349827 type:complete len:328 (+) Transcript_138062:122-1105(+)
MLAAAAAPIAAGSAAAAGGAFEVPEPHKGSKFVATPDTDGCCTTAAPSPALTYAADPNWSRQSTEVPTSDIESFTGLGDSASEDETQERFVVAPPLILPPPGLSLEEEEEEDDHLFGRNVVASVVKEGGGVGAFASPGASKMGITGSLEELDPFSEVEAAVSSTLRSRGSPLLGPADTSAASTVLSKLTSPLMAPSAQPPSLDLPPVVMGVSCVSPSSIGMDASPLGGASVLVAADGGSAGLMTDEGAGVGMGVSAGAGATAAGTLSTETHPDVQHLLVEMGDLMCHLQQKQVLAITQQEVQPEVMFERLQHFREVARATGLSRAPR